MAKWRHSFKQIFSSPNSEEETTSPVEPKSPIFEPGLPKEEDEPAHSGSFKYRKEVLRRRSEWAMSRANLQADLESTEKEGENVRLRKWSRDQMELNISDLKPKISITLSDPLPNLKENQIISPVSGSGSGLFDRSISFGTSSESENENKDKINENGEEEDTESELDDDCPTPLAARHSISTVTLTPIGAMPLDDVSDVHSRLLKLFKEDLDRLSYLVEHEMPDDERRRKYLNEVITNKLLRSLKTAVTINTHFFILSSVMSD